MKHGKLKLPCSTQILHICHFHMQKRSLFRIGGMGKHHTCPDATLKGNAPQFSELNQIGTCTSDVIPSSSGAVCPSFLDCDHGPTPCSVTSAHRDIPHHHYKRNHTLTFYHLNRSVTIKVQNHSPFQIKTKTTDKMSANTVHVKNISSATSEKEVKDFFSFW